MVDRSGERGSPGDDRRAVADEGVDGRLTWPDVRRSFEAGLGRTASSAGRGSLERVHQAVMALRAAGETITFVSVGAWCVARHAGPTFQSIQNNERLADIVRVAAAVQKSERRPSTGRPLEEEILECVLGNAELHRKTEALLADRRALIYEKDQLRHAFRRVEGISVVSKEMAEVGVTTLEELRKRIDGMQASSSGPGFTDQEREGCQAFLLVGMAKLGFEVDEPSGEIIDRSQRTVAGPGVASILRKAAGMAMLERAAKPTDVHARARKPR